MSSQNLRFCAEGYVPSGPDTDAGTQFDIVIVAAVTESLLILGTRVRKKRGPRHSAELFLYCTSGHRFAVVAKGSESALPLSHLGVITSLVLNLLLLNKLRDYRVVIVWRRIWFGHGY